jgi:hypothetical protein
MACWGWVAAHSKFTLLSLPSVSALNVYKAGPASRILMTSPI